MEINSGSILPTDHIHVGGTNRGSMQISNSAEFYHLLSESLYSDKELAAVREIICNGWDAHISAGITDKPLDIRIKTQNDVTTLYIRDFGKGIPDDEIIEIYGTYGNSTKRKNDLETGGFGLGSKAPFAVTGHFNVVNHHNGKKTMYKIVKEGTNGKPEVHEIFSIPSDESGIEVSFNIEERMVYTYESNIIRLVNIGGILADYNDEPLERVDWDDLELPVLFTDIGRIVNSKQGFSSRVAVKLGNVIYPLSFPDKLLELKRACNKLLTKTTHQQVIVIPMPGSSIRVTPSRESISYNEFTVDNILKYGMPLINKTLELSKSSIKRLHEYWAPKTNPNEHMNMLLNPHYRSVIKGYVSKLLWFDMMVVQSTYAEWKAYESVERFRKVSFNADHLLRRLHRIIGSYDFYKKPRYFSVFDKKSLKEISKYQSGYFRPINPNKIFIGYSRKQLNDQISSYKERFKGLGDFGNDEGAYITENYISFVRKRSDKIDENQIKELGEAYGIEIIFLPKPEVKKVTRTSPKIQKLVGYPLKAGFRHPLYCPLSDSTSDKSLPKTYTKEDKNDYYVLAYTGYSHNSTCRVTDWSSKDLPLLEEILGKPIILVHRAAQKQLFLKAGFKDAIDVFRDKSEKWVKSKELFILLTTFYSSYGYPYNQNMNCIRLVMHSKKLMNRYYKIRFKENPVYDKWIPIFKYLTSMISDRNYSFTKNFLDKIRKHFEKEFTVLTTETPVELLTFKSFLSLENLHRMIFKKKPSYGEYDYNYHSNIKQDKLTQLERLLILNEKRMKEYINE